MLWVFCSVGLGGVVVAARRIGLGGGLLYCLYSLAVLAPLGAAWLAVAPSEKPCRLALFAWARMVREAVADLLPFSHLGGLVAGGRVLTMAGISAPRVYASMVADMTTEMASQLLFTLFGLSAMLSVLLGERGGALRSAALGSAAALAAIIAIFIFGQRKIIGLAERLARRVLPRVALAIGSVDFELDRIYSDRSGVALSFLFNLIGWIASASGAWLLLYLIGAQIPLGTVIAIESLIFAVRSAAFAVPGALGFQEGAYVLAGPLFGLPPETALALSIAKRGRDVAIGLPTLLVWQFTELRGAFRSQ